jgi:phage tail sheath gpL-like
MSNAVSSDRISRIVGYKITKGNFLKSNPNLPQRIVILGEANEANQGTLDTDPVEILSAQSAGQLYGYGSPIHQMARIVKPVNGEGVGAIPVIVMAQAKAVGAVAKVIDITPTGAATANGTHTLVISGRKSVDGVFYDINIETGDTVAIVSAKIEDAINAVLGAPVIGTSTALKATATAKWNGLTSNDITITVDTNGNSLGFTYAVTTPTAGSGTPSVQAALDLFGSNWNTIVINGYGTVTSVLDSLEAFNGIPDPDAPTGRFVGIVMKPFIAITGSTSDDPSAITDARKTQVTIAIAPAPLSKGLQLEAAANMAVLFAVVSRENPHLDVAGKSYPDMPAPTVIGSMADYSNRDTIVKKGCSTVDLIAEKYQVQDFVTTYHPVGEEPPQFRYCRNLMLDFNVRYGYYLLEQINVVDHAIANNDDVVNAEKVIKPKQWKQVLDKYADDLASRALIVEPSFMQSSIEVNLSVLNPDRLETFFRYKRSGFARVASTTAEAGFNFGTIN